MRLGILTSPIGEAGITPLSNILKISKEISDNIYLITGNAAYIHFAEVQGINSYNASLCRSNNPIFRIFKNIALQIKISRYLLRIGKRVDCWICMFGAESQILPVLTLNLINRPVVLYFTGSSIKTQQYKKDLMLPVLKIIQYFTCHYATSIIVYSFTNIRDYGLKEWEGKVKIFSEHLIDTKQFSIRQRISDRGNNIGYIGRISEEKGICNLLESVKLFAPILPNYSILIIGDGDLTKKAMNFIQKSGLQQYVHFMGWIDHDILPEYLNQLKLLIIPSFTEGLPNIMLEAMACGTPVLANNVGAIADVIVDNVNGFLMSSNTPVSIKDNILRSINNGNLGNISFNASDYVGSNFLLQNKVQQFSMILSDSIRNME